MNSKVFTVLFVMVLFAAVTSAFGEYLQFEAGEIDSISNLNQRNFHQWDVKSVGNFCRKHSLSLLFFIFLGIIFSFRKLLFLRTFEDARGKERAVQIPLWRSSNLRKFTNRWNLYLFQIKRWIKSNFYDITILITQIFIPIETVALASR